MLEKKLPRNTRNASLIIRGIPPEVHLALALDNPCNITSQSLMLTASQAMHLVLRLTARRLSRSSMPLAVILHRIVCPLSSHHRDRQQFSVSGATRWVTMLDSVPRILPTPTQDMLMAAPPELLLPHQLRLVLVLRLVDSDLVFPTTSVEAG
jgi:hypothetical protein